MLAQLTRIHRRQPLTRIHLFLLTPLLSSDQLCNNITIITIMQYQITKKLFYGTHLAFISPIHHRLFSASLPSAENPAIKSPFAVEYLVKSCGLSRNKAIDASRHVPNLKSPAKSDSVLQFLRQIGLGDEAIRKTVTYEPRILCANLESTIKPRMNEIRELGFSPSQIIQLIPLNPKLFVYKTSTLKRAFEFWASYFGSLDGIIRALKTSPYLLTVSVEKVIEPNISFLEGHCGLSPSQIRKAIIRDPSLVTTNLNKLKEAAQRAEQIGSPRGSGVFIYALHITSSHSSSKLNGKINNLMNLGFSKSEIDSMIKKHPMLLTNSDERIRSSVESLSSDAGLDLEYISVHPTLLSYSLEQRLIPRYYVIKSLKSKGLCGELSFSYTMCLSEERFEDKFVKPYKDLIPEVCEAYEAACAGKISLKDKL